MPSFWEALGALIMSPFVLTVIGIVTAAIIIVAIIDRRNHS